MSAGNERGGGLAPDVGPHWYQPLPEKLYWDWLSARVRISIAETGDRITVEGRPPSGGQQPVDPVALGEAAGLVMEHWRDGMRWMVLERVRLARARFLANHLIDFVGHDRLEKADPTEMLWVVDTSVDEEWSGRCGRVYRERRVWSQIIRGRDHAVLGLGSDPVLASDVELLPGEEADSIEPEVADRAQRARRRRG